MSGLFHLRLHGHREGNRGKSPLPVCGAVSNIGQVSSPFLLGLWRGMIGSTPSARSRRSGGRSAGRSCGELAGGIAGTPGEKWRGRVLSHFLVRGTNIARRRFQKVTALVVTTNNRPRQDRRMGRRSPCTDRL